MPELPEVETVVRDVRPELVGRTVRAISVSRLSLRRPWQPAWTDRLIGLRFLAVRRRAKWILLDLDDSSRLVCHLGMTGQLTVEADSSPVKDHTHLNFQLDNARQLRFRDVRRFGSVEWFADETAVLAFLGERLGPEPWELEPKEFADTVRRSGRSLKAILLDQSVAAGVGNIYADEALHRAGLHPEQTGQQTSTAQAERLCRAIVEVIDHAIALRGSTIRDYIGGSGLRGGFQDEFRVYGRDGQPCLKCQKVIEVVRVAGRSSHFCPACQSRHRQPARPQRRPRQRP